MNTSRPNFVGEGNLAPPYSEPGQPIQTSETTENAPENEKVSPN